MKKQIKILLLLLSIGSFPLFAQVDLEEEIFDKIYTITQDIVDAKKAKTSIKPLLKKYKELTESVKGNDRLEAVVNASIGQSLKWKDFHKEAKVFFIKAYKHRKAQGDFLPQRWALKALIDNGLNRGDFKFAFKYSKIWINHMKAHPENLKELREVYEYSSSLENSISKDANLSFGSFNFRN